MEASKAPKAAKSKVLDGFQRYAITMIPATILTRQKSWCGRDYADHRTAGQTALNSVHRRGRASQDRLEARRLSCPHTSPVQVDRGLLGAEFEMEWVEMQVVGAQQGGMENY